MLEDIIFNMLIAGLVLIIPTAVTWFIIYGIKLSMILIKKEDDTKRKQAYDLCRKAGMIMQGITCVFLLPTILIICFGLLENMIGLFKMFWTAFFDPENFRLN